MLYIFIPRNEPEVAETAHTDGANTLNGCNAALGVTGSTLPEPEVEEFKWSGLAALGTGLDQLYNARARNERLLEELPEGFPAETERLLLERYAEIDTFYSNECAPATTDLRAVIRARIIQLDMAIDDFEALLEAIPEGKLTTGADRALLALATCFKA